MEEIHVGEMWTPWLIPSGTTSDPWSTEGNGLPVLSFAECQHTPGKLKKYPPPGCKQVHDLRSDVSPSSRQAAQIFQEKGAKGVTQLQNTKLLAMGGLGNKRGEFCGARGSRRGKGMF